MKNSSKAEALFKKHAAIEICVLVGTGKSDAGENDVILVIKKSEDYAQ